MYSRRKPVEEVPTAETEVWLCTNESCNGWMRRNFTFQSQPVCVQCASEMDTGTKVLPVLTNHAQSLA